MNPYLIIGFLVFWLVSCAGAFYKGSSMKEDQMRAQYATQLEAKIAEHNANAEKDKQAAVAAAAKEAAARARAATIRSQASAVTLSKPLPTSCDLDPPRVRVLAAAIAAANGTDAPAADGVRDAVTKANAARK